MSKGFEFELNREGVRELMKCAEMQKILKETGASVVSNCAEGEYKMDMYIGKNRANVKVSADDAPTYYKNLKHNYLLKALGSSRRK